MFLLGLAIGFIVGGVLTTLATLALAGEATPPEIDIKQMIPDPCRSCSDWAKGEDEEPCWACGPPAWEYRDRARAGEDDE